MIKKFVLYPFLLVLFSCNEFAVKEQVVGKYYLIATDGIENCNLGYEGSNGSGYTTIIEATVFAVGYNQNYIIAKQHPLNSLQPPEKKIINYYILPLKSELIENMKSMLGPLTRIEFDKKRTELGIPDSVKFTKKAEY